MNETQSTQEVIKAARDGDQDALAVVRSWLPAQKEAGPMHRLLVRRDGMLMDLMHIGPRQRREVFAPVPRFGNDDPLLQGLAPLTRAACAAVRACPPLAVQLQHAAAAHLWTLERQLYVNDTLERGGREQLERALRVLQSLQRPLWENWVHAMPAWRRDEIDAVVDRWLDAPVDWCEQRWFMPDWADRPHQVVAAGALAAALSAPARQYLGLQLVQVSAGRLRVQAVQLQASAADASGWAERAGLAWRFEVAPPAQDADAAALASAPASAPAATRRRSTPN